MDELAGAAAVSCGAGRPAVMLTDKSKDRDNHGCYEQHFITVVFGQNSICRCPLFVSVLCLHYGDTHVHTHTHAQMEQACLLCASTKPHQVEIIVLLGIVEGKGDRREVIHSKPFLGHK